MSQYSPQSCFDFWPWHHWQCARAHVGNPLRQPSESRSADFMLWLPRPLAAGLHPWFESKENSWSKKHQTRPTAFKTFWFTARCWFLFVIECYWTMLCRMFRKLPCWTLACFKAQHKTKSSLPYQCSFGSVTQTFSNLYSYLAMGCLASKKPPPAQKEQEAAKDCFRILWSLRALTVKCGNCVHTFVFK